MLLGFGQLNAGYNLLTHLFSCDLGVPLRRTIIIVNENLYESPYVIFFSRTLLTLKLCLQFLSPS